MVLPPEETSAAEELAELGLDVPGIGLDAPPTAVAPNGASPAPIGNNGGAPVPGVVAQWGPVATKPGQKHDSAA